MTIRKTIMMNMHKCQPTQHGTLMITMIMMIMVITKMAIILPTGQWYAPSAVINDARYYMVLHGIA